MKFCAFSHTCLTVCRALSEHVKMYWPVDEGVCKVKYVLASRYLANHFELPESTANYFLDQLIVRGYVKVEKDDGEFYVFVPIIK